VHDAAELTRLRAIMIATFSPIESDDWRPLCIAAFERHLADPDGPLQAFVTDAPGEPGMLASCAVGVITNRLPSPRNPLGLAGYVMSVATDPRHRRQGHSRASVVALLDWFRSRQVRQIELHASEYGEHLYRDLGFVEPAGLALRLMTS
jgi:GNAT superfamily N-acetyltransferase